MTTTQTITDHDATMDLIAAFNIDADFGWDTYNALPWEDGHQQRRVQAQLIAAEILYGCPNCDRLSTEAFDCNCQDDYPSDSGDDQSSDGDYDLADSYDDEPDEDPLAGDVDPTGGYPEPAMHPFDAQRLEVMRQYGDYTGGW